MAIPVAYIKIAESAYELDHLSDEVNAQVGLLHLAAIVNDLPPQSACTLASMGRFQTHANAIGRSTTAMQIVMEKQGLKQ